MSEGDATIAAERLHLFVERAERLMEERSGISEDLREVFAEAKGQGYDVKAMRAVIRLRKTEPQIWQQAEAILETYKAALGMGEGPGGDVVVRTVVARSATPAAEGRLRRLPADLRAQVECGKLEMWRAERAAKARGVAQ